MKPEPATPFLLERSDVTLGNLLKLKMGVSGGTAKQMIQDGYIQVDGELCVARGKRLRGGELVEIQGFGAIRVQAPNQDT